MELDPKRLPPMLDELFSMWGRMHGVAEHKASCRTHAGEIVQAFVTSATANEVLAKLLHIEGIGLTIGTGLLWAWDPDRFVPFDKRTTGFCLIEKWIRKDGVVSADYEKTCRRVIEAAVGEGKRFATIRELVDTADDVPKEFYCSPR